MQTEVLTGGFNDAPAEAARAFRAILDAMARPGRIATLAGAAAPAPVSVAAAVAVLTLADRTTPLWLGAGHDLPAVRDWITFHTGAPLVPEPGAAMLALGGWAEMLPLDRFAQGSPDYPDRSATLIVAVQELAARGARLTGPGIEGEHRLSLPGSAEFRANRARFPLGLDMLFVAGDRVAALPRSTIVEAG